MAIWVVNCDCCLCEVDPAVLVGKWSQANEDMGEVRHDMPRQSFRIDARVALATKPFGATIGHADSYGWSPGIVVGNWGIERKVVSI